MFPATEGRQISFQLWRIHRRYGKWLPKNSVLLGLHLFVFADTDAGGELEELTSDTVFHFPPLFLCSLSLSLYEVQQEGQNLFYMLQTCEYIECATQGQPKSRRSQDPAIPQPFTGVVTGKRMGSLDWPFWSCFLTTAAGSNPTLAPTQCFGHPRSLSLLSGWRSFSLIPFHASAPALEESPAIKMFMEENQE